MTRFKTMIAGYCIGGILLVAAFFFVATAADAHNNKRQGEAEIAVDVKLERTYPNASSVYTDCLKRAYTRSYVCLSQIEFAAPVNSTCFRASKVLVRRHGLRVVFGRVLYCIEAH